VEAGFVGGLGLNCHYYPYLPVGAIREGLLAIRRRRSAGHIDPGLIVLLGSAYHEVTGESMRWFAEHVSEDGLPSGVRAVAVGYGTDGLLSPDQTPASLELRGWVPQAELDNLLARAVAAVIPQRQGFGALTRLPELACAGVPVITFCHPSYAINPPPGLRTVAPDWEELCAAVRDSLAGPVVVDARAYETWEADQPRPLADVLPRLLGS
jgi:glycosyltransferase involved in cell wall biosynthesis